MNTNNTDTEFHCKHCGAEIKIGNIPEGFTICPNCQTVYKFLRANDKVYIIDYHLYQAGENKQIPYQPKDSLSLKARQGIEWSKNKYKKIPPKTKNIIGLSAACIFILSIITYFLLKPAAIEKSLAYQDREKVAIEFRKKNPYNIQTVGIKKYTDNSYMILLTEPNDSVSKEDLTDYFEDYNCDIKLYNTKIGVDGWLRDASICINDLSDRKFEKFKSGLFNLLYGTDYKAEFQDLSVIPSHENYIDQNLNLQISAEELRLWFLGKDAEKFSGINNEQSGTIKELVSKDATGVFQSQNPGFIVWILNNLNSGDYDKFKTESRMFSLDSDLIVGALKKDNLICIIGRERETPISVLPPMRSETLAILASTEKEELSQSYERNQLFAGKMKGGKDVAPILLSPELWHTEYGSLLNVADQMLKSWSENGDINYEQFNYKKPIEWAFNDGALEDLNTYQLTYNWNTAGAGFIEEAEDSGDFDIFAVNRTGSLPVSYIPGDTENVTENDKVFKAEENAYEFFSNLSNPELIKVVQYASMFQIFKNMGFSLSISPSVHSLQTTAMETEAEKILNELYYFDLGKEDKIKKKLKEDAYQHDLAIFKFYLPNANLDNFTASFNKYYEVKDTVYIPAYREIKEIVKNLKDRQLSNGQSAMSAVAHYIVNPREIDYSRIYSDDSTYLETEDDIAQQYASSINLYSRELQFYRQLFSSYTPDKMKADYIKENRNRSSKWIKCPTVVQSWSKRDSVYMTGGHNLSSRITPIKVSKNLKPGQFEVEVVNGKKIINVSAIDRGKISPSLLRTVERTNVKGIRSFGARTVEAIPSRARAKVISMAPRKARGFSPDLVISMEKGQFTMNGKKMDTIDDLFFAINKDLSETGTSPVKNIKFEKISEDKVKVLMDGVEKSGHLAKTEGNKVYNAAFDLSKAEYDISRSATEGITVIKIPVKSQQLKAKASFYTFEIPQRFFKQFMEGLRQLLENPKLFWSDFKLKKMLKEQGIDPAEVREFQEYMISKLYKNLHFIDSTYDTEEYA